MLSRAEFRSPWPPLAWAVFVALMLLVPGSLSESSSSWAALLSAYGADKLIHAGLFLVQAYWLARGLGDAFSARWAWLGAGGSALYGCALEVAQIAVPGRGFDPLDIVANTAGAVLWALIARLRGVS